MMLSEEKSASGGEDVERSEIRLWRRRWEMVDG